VLCIDRFARYNDINTKKQFTGVIKSNMPKWPSLINGFKLLKEVDLNAVREKAEAPVHVMVVGREGCGRTTLVNHLLAGPRQGHPPGIPPLSEHGIDGEIIFKPECLVLLVLDAKMGAYTVEKEIFGKLLHNGARVVVCYNKMDLIADRQAVLNGAVEWKGAEVVAVSAIDRQSLLRELVPAIMRTCKGLEIPLARRVPLLREPVCSKLIDEACFVNSAYSLTTGLAEINVLLDIPLNFADIVVLTKNQALMSYKISLAMGMAADWKETMPKLAAVVGSAFLWRQAARSLVGLIPAWGIIPKVAIAYAGTYAVGQAIYHWCASGEKIKQDMLKPIYNAALQRGRDTARLLLQRKRNGQLMLGETGYQP
jgi:uncharacterized protein (DUF697 family)